MRILYYSPHPFLNLSSAAGYATHMNEMIAAFRAAGHDVKTLIMGGELPTGQKEAHVAASGSLKLLLKKIIPSYCWESMKDWQLRRFDKKAQSQLAKLITEWQPDLIYERCNYLQSSGVATAKRFAVRHVLEINSPYVEERQELGGRSYFQKHAHRIEKQQIQDTSLAVVVSSALCTYFQNKHAFSNDKFLVLPNAVNGKHAVSKSSSSIKSNLQRRNVETVFGFVGSIFPWHGIDILTDAFAELAMKYPTIGLMIVGDGETLPAIIEKVSAWPFANRVWFVGKQPHDEVFSYIDAMDCAVMVKSNWYGSPVKIFEYGSLCKPVIAPATIPVKDVMLHKKHGLLVKPTVEDIKAAMVYVIENRVEMNEMAIRFRDKVYEQHLWEHNAEKLLKKIKYIVL